MDSKKVGRVSGVSRIATPRGGLPRTRPFAAPLAASRNPGPWEAYQAVKAELGRQATVSFFHRGALKPFKKGRG